MKRDQLKSKYVLIILTASLLGLFIRVLFFNYETPDYIFFLTNWMDVMDKTEGFKRFGLDLGDYTCPYMYCYNNFSSGKQTLCNQICFMPFWLFISFFCLRYNSNINQEQKNLRLDMSCSLFMSNSYYKFCNLGSVRCNLFYLCNRGIILYSKR